MKKWIFMAIVFLVAGIIWLVQKKSCKSRLSVINDSGGAVIDFEVYASDTRLDKPSVSLAAGGQKAYAFSGVGQGAYIIRFTDAEGTRIEDSQGDLFPGTAFNDTLTLLPTGGSNRYRLRQATSACKEPIRANYFFRRLLRDIVRNL